jgi:hypothetical protein
MTVLVYDQGRSNQDSAVATATFSFFDTGALDIVSLGGPTFEDVTSWPEGSRRMTTSVSARMFESRVMPESEPRLPDVEINDGLGL